MKTEHRSAERDGLLTEAVSRRKLEARDDRVIVLPRDAVHDARVSGDEPVVSQGAIRIG